MFDLLDKHGRTSIKREWASLDNDIIPMEEFPGRAGGYIKLVKRIYEKHRYFHSMGHCTPSYRFSVFTQCLANNCQVMRGNDASAWMHNVNLALGSSALFKIQPSMFNDKKIDLTSYRTVFSGGHPKILNQPIEQNACIATPSQACITNTSGVTSELLIGEKQVVTTGESWFSGLGVFHEVKKWDNLSKTANDVAGQPISSKQAEARLKFANWWRNHQAMTGEESSVLLNLVNYFKAES
jgi:capsule polysaccharide export protein KpsC/LpsZ